MVDFRALYNKKIGVVVDARISSAATVAGSSLFLEGILVSETEALLKLTDAETTHKYKPSFKTDELYINKDKIVLLYKVESDSSEE